MSPPRRTSLEDMEEMHVYSVTELTRLLQSQDLRDDGGAFGSDA